MAAGSEDNSTVKARLLGDNAGTLRRIGANRDGMLHSHLYPQFGTEQDLTANDSDKSFTVPAAHFWIVHWIFVLYTSSTTAGNRDVVAEIQDDAANVLARIPLSATFPSAVTRHLILVGASAAVDRTSAEAFTAAFPGPLILPAGYVIRVYDLAAIDAGGDDMEVTIGRQEIDDT